MMRLREFTFFPYEMPLLCGEIRQGFFLSLIDEAGLEGWGEVAPLPQRSSETWKDCAKQLNEKRQKILEIDWEFSSFLDRIKDLLLFPSVIFGLESALLSLLAPLSDHCISASALLMGSPQEIREQAILRHREGWTSAKLKVSHLNFKEAKSLIMELKNKFYLRLDVNRAWKTGDSLKFFEQFPLNTFDYVEEPFQDPQDLALFPHPLAVDESFPKDLSLEDLSLLPTLKALIYKPTIQGGLSGCLDLHEWTTRKGIQLILSSSFETDLGLAHIASLAHRLSLRTPIGIGTFYFLQSPICVPNLRFAHSSVYASFLQKPRSIIGHSFKPQH